MSKALRMNRSQPDGEKGEMGLPGRGNSMGEGLEVRRSWMYSKPA